MILSRIYVILNVRQESMIFCIDRMKTFDLFKNVKMKICHFAFEKCTRHDHKNLITRLNGWILTFTGISDNHITYQIRL